METKQFYNALLAQKLINELKKRNMEGFYIEEVSKVAEASCSQLVITGMSMIKDRIKVILVGENLGF